MRGNLIQYVNLLFAGTSGTEEIKQEILQNTLDRYDDLIAQGKAPEAAYSLAISGIGDISEILNNRQYEVPAPVAPAAAVPENAPEAPWKKYVRAGAIFLYIVCAIPLFILSEFGMDTIGLCATISIAAVATVAIILSGSGKNDKKVKNETPKEAETPQQELRNAVKKIINTVGLVLYFGLSFTTGAWHITWLVFPIEGAVWGLVKACMDLKEANTYEA